MIKEKNKNNGVRAYCT